MYFLFFTFFIILYFLSFFLFVASDAKCSVFYRRNGAYASTSLLSIFPPFQSHIGYFLFFIFIVTVACFILHFFSLQNILSQHSGVLFPRGFSSYAAFALFNKKKKKHISCKHRLMLLRCFQ